MDGFIGVEVFIFCSWFVATQKRSGNIKYKLCLLNANMESTRGKIVRGSKNAKGKIRKWIEIPELYYDDFDFGDIVKIEKVKDVSQESG